MRFIGDLTHCQKDRHDVSDSLTNGPRKTKPITGVIGWNIQLFRMKELKISKKMNLPLIIYSVAFHFVNQAINRFVQFLQILFFASG